MGNCLTTMDENSPTLKYRIKGVMGYKECLCDKPRDGSNPWSQCDNERCPFSHTKEEQDSYIVQIRMFRTKPCEIEGCDNPHCYDAHSDNDNQHIRNVDDHMDKE